MKNHNEQKKKIDTGTIKARGYRVLIDPIDVTVGLEAAQADKFQTLASAGFVTKSNDQKEREDRGSNYGVVLDIGPDAYKNMRRDIDAAPWCKIGDVVMFRRYEGARIEFPPGSSEYVIFINDEDVFGSIE